MGYEWILGLGFIFGFAFVLTALMDFSIENFLGMETYMSAFVVYWDFLPLWVLVINLLILTYILMSEFKSRSL